MRKHIVAAVALMAGTGALAAPEAIAERRPAEPASAAVNAVVEWNQATATAAQALALDPLHESRLYAMVHIAIHDSLNTIDRRFEPYALDVRAGSGASPDAAVATAAHDVLVSVVEHLPEELYPPDAVDDALLDVETAYAAALAAIPDDGTARDQGVTIGHAGAAVVLAARVDDGAASVKLLDFDYEQGVEPGEFRFVDGSPLAFAPTWYEVTPFVLRAASQFLPRPPLDVTSRRYAADVNEVQRLGGDDVKTPSARTDDETEIARFWFESSPAMWNRIAVTVSTQAGLDMWEQARLLALMDMGMADGYIGNWYSKYAAYNRWRPETAIRLAGSDGNPATTGDPGWTPLIPTGATPSYDSGHTIEGAVAAGVMARLIGTDDIAFSACSRTLLAGNCDDASPTMRDFTSLSQAAAENGLSRILVGWHFRDDVDQGAKHGTRIAELAVARYLRPVAG